MITTDGVTYTISLDTLSGDAFKIATSDWTTDFGGSEDQTIVLGEAYTCWPGSSVNLQLAAGEVKDATLTLVIGESNASLTVTGTVAESYPETLYLIGDFYTEDNEIVHWNPAKGIALTKIDEGKFESPLISTTADSNGEEPGYFSFCEFLSEDWDSVGRRYGAESSDYMLKGVGTNALISGTNSFSIVPSYLKLVVDLKAGTLEITTQVGVGGVEAEEDAVVDVYNFSGVRILSGVSASEALKNLPKGLYIVGGKKVVIK